MNRKCESTEPIKEQPIKFNNLPFYSVCMPEH